jgi:hypothetical protein
MASRQPNYRLVKIHRNYSVEEVARGLGVHRNTVRQWIKQGLPICDARRPVIILGKHLADFLKARRAKNKRPCRPGEIYCVRCRDARMPCGSIAEYRPLTATQGDLVGVCPQCSCRMFRRVSLARVADVSGKLTVTITEAASHIGDSPQPSVNSDFNREPSNHANAQSK